MKDLFKRSLTGFAFLVIVIGSIIFSSISFIFLFLLLIILCLIEFYDIAKKGHSRPQIFLGIVISIFFFILNFLYAANYIDLKLFLFIIPLILMIFMAEIHRYKKQPLQNISITLTGILYIGIPISLFNYFVFNTGMDFQEYNPSEITGYEPLNNFFNLFNFEGFRKEVVYTPDILLGYFILIWTYDSFAYIIGSLIGRSRLTERISPKKSWEGLIGGFIITFGVSYLISLVYTTLSFADWAIITLIITLMATYGDLIESLFKRSVNIKDSGKIMPGHGGILDRFDGVFLSAPMVFVYLEIIKFS